jgi:hypothetical protein
VECLSSLARGECPIQQMQCQVWGLSISTRIYKGFLVSPGLASPEMGRQNLATVATVWPLCGSSAPPHTALTSQSPRREALCHAKGYRQHQLTDRLVRRERRLTSPHQLWVQAEQGQGEVVGMLEEPCVGKCRYPR